jgi:hypothetical protein
MAYPKRRAAPKKIACEICGEHFSERGIKSHLRLFHKLKVTEITQVIEPEITQVIPRKITQVTKSEKGGKITTPEITQVIEEKITQVIRTYTPTKGYVPEYHPKIKACDGCRRSFFSYELGKKEGIDGLYCYTCRQPRK